MIKYIEQKCPNCGKNVKLEGMFRMENSGETTDVCAKTVVYCPACDVSCEIQMDIYDDKIEQAREGADDLIQHTLIQFEDMFSKMRSCDIMDA